MASTGKSPTKKQKYYGVAEGHTTGIFTSWSMCNKQVNKYSGSCHASFETLEKCTEFMMTKGTFPSADSILVYGPRGKEYSMTSWKDKLAQELSNTQQSLDRPAHTDAGDRAQTTDGNHGNDNETATISGSHSHMFSDISMAETETDIKHMLTTLVNMGRENNESHKEIIRLYYEEKIKQYESELVNNAKIIDFLTEENSLLKQTFQASVNDQTSETPRAAIQDLTSELLRLLMEKTAQCEALQLKLLNKTHDLEQLKAAPCKTYAKAMGGNKSVEESTPEKMTLLLGSSLIRNVSSRATSRNNIPVKVHKHSGATFADLKDDLDLFKSIKPEEIILVAGTREANGDKPLDEVTKDINDLLVKAKSLSDCVTISSVLPMTSKDVRLRTKQINTCIEKKAAEMDVAFAENDKNFLFQDGEADPSALVTDGVHLSQVGTMRLMTNIGISLPSRSDVTAHPDHEQNDDEWHQVRQRRNRRNDQRREGRKIQRDGACRDRSNSGQVERRDDERDDRRTSEAFCWFCGESGHVKSTCRHGHKLECNSCKKLGHKSKFCYLYE